MAAALIATAVLLGSIPGQGDPAAFSLLFGAALGILFERGRFCFFCIYRDLFEKKDSTGSYSILVALAVGGVGYAILFSLFLPDPTTGRLPPEAHIGPVSWALVIAGIVFGLGMALSGACISGHLYRLGEGYLRAIPALAGTILGFGLGFFTWNTVYLGLISGSQSLWLPSLLGYGGSVGVHLAVLVAVGIVLLRWLPRRPERAAYQVTATEVRRALFFRRWPTLLTGALVGLVGVFAYLRVEPLGVTAQLGSIARTALDEAGALPGVLYGLDTLAGCATMVVETIMANGWLVIGLVLASFAAALPGRRVRVEPVTLYNGTTALLGGVLLGWGAMTALGCTVGVYLSGTQAFAVSGWVFAAAVTAGVWVGIRLKLHTS